MASAARMPPLPGQLGHTTADRIDDLQDDDEQFHDEYRAEQPGRQHPYRPPGDLQGAMR